MNFAGLDSGNGHGPPITRSSLFLGSTIRLSFPIKPFIIRVVYVLLIWLAAIGVLLYRAERLLVYADAIRKACLVCDLPPPLILLVYPPAHPLMEFHNWAAPRPTESVPIAKDPSLPMIIQNDTRGVPSNAFVG
jgi:hypothetical protein